MKLQIDWSRPIRLRDAAHLNMIYSLDLKKLPSSAGIYVFGRQWGKSFEALYVGQATKIQKRVKSQLNNLRLMQHVKNARTGHRVVFAGKLDAKPGQQMAKALDLIEKARKPRSTSTSATAHTSPIAGST